MQTNAFLGAPGTMPGEMAALAAQQIARAHERSTAFGLRRTEAADLQPVDAEALAWMVARNEALFAHARPVMETLSAQIAGTQSMVLLTDARGVVLHALGDDEFLDRASRVALRPGAAWSERSKGTNAIGTALALGEALQVNGSEHFLQANHFLTCSCAPILDPHGRVIGALDVSGDHRSQSAHTLALVRMSAKMVENHLFGKVFEDAVRLRFHARPEFLGTLVEGLAAFTPDGRFLAANRSGQFQLGLSANALQAHTFPSLFGLSMGALLAHARQSVPELLRLQLPGGVAVQAQVEFRLRSGTLLPMAEAGERDDLNEAGGLTDAACAKNHRGLPSRSADAAEPGDGAMPRSARPRQAMPGKLSSLCYLDTGDAQLAQVIDRVTRLLGSDVSTLILGETGTGKELLARAIHQDGPRHRGPFVAVNCASIPESLIESELFGYDEGAFTGARRKGSVGKIAQADGGTLFLDEIGDMPLSMQARLLRVLQERSVSPLGSARQVPVDVAVVCATHRNLREMMAQGTFRDDLYYRLNGLVVRLPALRERTDLAVIVERVLRAQAEESTGSMGSTGGAVPRIAPQAMALFAAHAWPGNLRQLSSVLRTGALMARGDGGVIQRTHLPEDFLEDCDQLLAHANGMADSAGETAFHRSASSGPQGTADGHALPFRSGAPVSGTAVPRLGDTTAAALGRALDAHGGNVSAAARALGVSRNTIYRHLKAMQAAHAASAEPPMGARATFSVAARAR
ncbi:sigma-54-dependent Fis family transcriptional regulator [Acidovorax sp. SUPP3334]|uniref:sigma-54-dependent Fis family transcriptional regulator n=1 Tax=Acidovorax sp. SUPP3334 TaxID=2920881 RepID=UPI0023DE4EAF|nr:sigma-54-dependent Fis family transcriptional regulator [Acidovorax sp. SUPP3334]GKT21559.1 sigma-54-dependent Fis family transcriptional regulator [Acidovorax sp. SUPP3334]